MKYTKELHDTISQMICSKDFDGHKAMMFDIEFVVSMHNEIERMQEEARWIPVSERLPKNDQVVNAFQNDVLGACVFPSWYHDKFFYQQSEMLEKVTAPVTHWRPLPPAPMDEEQE